MDKAEGPELTIKFLTARILGVNFASIHVGPHVVFSCTYDAEIFHFVCQDEFQRTLCIDDPILTCLIDAT